MNASANLMRLMSEAANLCHLLQEDDSLHLQSWSWPRRPSNNKVLDLALVSFVYDDCRATGNLSVGVKEVPAPPYNLTRKGMSWKRGGDGGRGSAPPAPPER